MSLILALECDPDRGRTLKRLVSEWMDAEVVVASSTDQAIEFMHQHGPDLILVSALTPPGDDSSLTEFLRQTPGTRHVPALTVPPLMDDPDEQAVQGRRRGPLSILGLGRKTRLRQSYDGEALRARLREALDASCQVAQTSAYEARTDVISDLPVEEGDPFLEQLLHDFARSHGERGRTDGQATLDHGESPSMHTRARRWSSKDLSWLTEVKLPWGLRVELLNISSSGLLVESAARFVEGSTTAFRLIGADRDMVVPARVIRSTAVAGNAGGVRYQAAVTFDQALLEAELLRPAAGSVPDASPSSEQDLTLERPAPALEPSRVLRYTFEESLPVLFVPSL